MLTLISQTAPPGGKPHTLHREEKKQSKVEKKTWRSRGKVLVERKKKEGKSERNIKRGRYSGKEREYEQNKREEKWAGGRRSFDVFRLSERLHMPF